MTQVVPPFSMGVQISLGPGKPAVAPHPRIAFERCPLCDGSGTSSSCAPQTARRHPLYHPAISPTMTWMHCESFALTSSPTAISRRRRRS